MLSALFAKIESWFSSPTAHTVAADISQGAQVATTILKAFPGIAGSHTTAIVSAVATAASSGASDEEKRAAVASVVSEVAPHLSPVAVAVAETAYQLYKAEGSPVNTGDIPAPAAP